MLNSIRFPASATLALLLGFGATSAAASDHLDSPSVIADSRADIGHYPHLQAPSQTIAEIRGSFQ